MHALSSVFPVEYRDRAAIFEILTKNPFEVQHFYSDNPMVLRLYGDIGKSEPDYTEGPKLYEENVACCAEIIKTLDRMERQAG